MLCPKNYLSELDLSLDGYFLIFFCAYILAIFSSISSFVFHIPPSSSTFWTKSCYSILNLVSFLSFSCFPFSSFSSHCLLVIAFRSMDCCLWLAFDTCAIFITASLFSGVSESLQPLVSFLVNITRSSTSKVVAFGFCARR